MLAVSMLGVAEAFMLGKRLGLDFQKIFDVTSTSSGQSWALTSYCPVPGPVPASPANRDYQAGFTAAMMLKDLMLAQQAAIGAGASTPLGAEAAQLFNLFVSQGNGAKDFSGIIKMLEGKA
jgi:3-hydroxyisobutyrate dehydrogenase